MPGPMASSGTEVRWAGPGLGKGPQRRRRWAWAEEEKDADRSSTCGWGDDAQPFLGTTSPELLEDFRLAQQHGLPLEWNLDLRELGGSSGEEVEAEDVDSSEDVDSPEGSPLPLSWHPWQGHQPDMCEKEPDVTPTSTEAKEAGASSPRLGCEADPSSEDNENPSAVDVGWGQARDWVASSKAASGNKHSEHSEVNPPAELSLARSWSSGTVSLGQPSDSLDSTWEGETDIPLSSAVAEILPRSPSPHLLPPDDRTGDGVAPVTPTEFQGSSALPAQSPQSDAGRWRAEPASLPSSQLKGQTCRWTKTSPEPLPSRFTGSSSPLTPRPRPAQKDRSEPRQGDTLAGRSSSDAPKYGRGRLNYPLPDFSKVGPRVRFPKDESYRPPKSKSHNREPQGSVGPLIFKSPAEIVREVLLNSGDVSLAKDPHSAHPVTMVPQEFQTPEQATELVHQLQEDYHKLLTKYAEAENTIDQLRLGAKIHLYSDPPRPSQSIHMGTVPQGTKVLSFTIPQPRSAEWRPSPTKQSQASEVAGWPTTQGELSSSSHAKMPTPGWLPECQGTATTQPSTEWTQVLASQASQLLAKVESFERLMQAEQLTPQDQLKGFLRLRAAHTALEEEYLRACRELPSAPQLVDSQGTPRKFDPSRELEAEIYHLGIRLEEMQDQVDQMQREPEPSRAEVTLDGTPVPSIPHLPAPLPAPSGQASMSTAASQIPHPEAQPTAGPCSLHVDRERSLGSSKTELSPRGLPVPLRHKELRMEQDFHGLLQRYLSVKSVPEALQVEEEKEQQGKDEEGEEEEEEEGEEEEEESHHTPRVNGPASASSKAEATRVPPWRHPAQAERSPRSPTQDNVEHMVSRKLPGFQTSKARHRHLPGMCKTQTAPLGPGVPPNSADTTAAASHQSSLSSLEGSGLSEHLAQKTLPQESWMASPETDSGFVGSETSRVSPLTQTPEHRLSHLRREAGPSTPRHRAVWNLSGRSGHPQNRTPASHLEQAFSVAMGLPGSEFRGRKQISEWLLPSRTTNPEPTQVPGAAPSTPGPAETTSDLLLTRTERDQAIRELQAEVSRLRLRLEDSLQPPSQRSPKAASAFDHAARTRDRTTNSSATGGSHSGSKSIERLSREPEGTERAWSAGRRRSRSSSAPRLSPSSECEPLSPQLPSGKIRTSEDSPHTAPDSTRGTSVSRRPDRVSFQGQYTGKDYHVLFPKTILRGSSSASCAHCQPIMAQDTGAAVKDPLRLSASGPLLCPLCGRAGSPPEGDGPSSATSGTDKAATRKDAPPASSPRQRSKQAGSPARPPSGLWYLAAAPPPPAPPAFAYISSVPIMPYPPATVYYAPPAPTSAPKASSRPSRGHRHSLQLDLDDLQEMHRALSRAVQVAKSVRSTSRQMRRSLSADLRQSQGLRDSCLF
ncbi:microtubule organization protein AKNA isoform X2 [Cavia porcellus]|uniref:microtubule organization protein AKNA isoform X2 n=1 Tax=Cavia porcellus TaxID=10141 RepID=UPI002FE12C99